MSFWKGFAGGLQAGATIRDRWDERGGFGITGLGSDSRGATAEKPAGADAVSGGDGTDVPAMAASSPSAAPRAVPGTASQREVEAARYYVQAGLPPAAAAALAGNQAMESSFNTNARNRGDGRDGSDSIGISQWNGSRAVALQRFAQARGTSPSDFQTQLAFTVHELGGSERAAGAALRAARNPDEAARAAIGYFRPQGWTAANPSRGHNFAARVQQMQRILPQITSRQAAAPQDTMQGGGADSGRSPIRVRPGEARFEPIFAPAAQPAPARQARPDTLDGGDGAGISATGARGPLTILDDQSSPLGRQPGRPLGEPVSRINIVPQPTPPRPFQGAPETPDTVVPPPAPRQFQAPPETPETLAPPAAAAAAAAAAPSEAPVPNRRPAEAPGAPGSAPLPQPRPFGAPGLGVSERDRLMLLRDEGSLAPDEAERLRAGLPAGGSPFGFFGLGRGRG